MNNGAPMTKGMTKLGHRLHNHTVCNVIRMIRDEDKVETKFLRCKDDDKNSENAKNKSEMIGELDYLFLC
jgi:hypothetical protein